MTSRLPTFVAAVLVLAVSVWLGYPDRGVATPRVMPVESEASEDEEPVLLGPLARGEIEAAVPDWVEAEMEAQADLDAAVLLESAFDGAEVVVFMGTWCSDSRRELARLWRALDDIGADHPGQMSYIGVDRDKQEPSALVDGHDLLYVPTFIVRRDGHEVGRIVEESPSGIEVDLLALLSGEKKGLVTAKEELLDENDAEQEE
ncbi:MAG: thioredoxin family protein [Thermoanaerobaculia bacterium]